MCVVSMIGDEFTDRWKPYFPPYNPQQPYPQSLPSPDLSKVTREEFDSLKREVDLMKSLLIRAKLYDEKNNEPDCEMENKVKLLKAMGEALGVDLSAVFNKQEKQ